MKGVMNTKTKNYLDFQLWFGKIKDKMEELEAKDQIEIAFRVAVMLLNKVSNLPQTPQESADNASARQEILLALESKNESQPENESSHG